jgi:cation transport ATPase
VLISSDLDDLTRTVHVARRARRIVMFNFVGTIAVDLIGIALAAFGFLSPVVAALVHVGSETAFILNSARLIPGRRAR